MGPVATSANRHNAIARLTTAGLSIPEILITADDVGQGKPHPEPFLLAAKRLGVATSKCLAFEDSDQGVRSALNAGCEVVVVNRFCTIQHDHIVARINHYKDIYLSEEVSK
ncbi:HAD family hydrolase [Pseudoalteromonas galatheae]|uniref:HAD family hydrolase n=1 Tax=Pseudoalteromonas galatheae TaxID=579562 RepID=UPI0030D4580A